MKRAFILAIALGVAPMTIATTTPSFAAEKQQTHPAITAFFDAYNQLGSDPSAAAQGARRALSLADSKLPEEDKAEIELLVVLAEFYADPSSRRASDRLLDTLEERDDDGYADTALSARGWIGIARIAAARGDWDRLTGFGERAEKAIMTVQPDSQGARANAIAYQGMGLLRDTLQERITAERGNRPSRLRNQSTKATSGILEAIERFDRGIEVFDTQPDMENFHPTLAQLIAWRAASVAVLKTLSAPDAIRVTLPENMPAIPWPARDTNASCDFEWAQAPDPDYPATAGLRGYVGAVVASYDFEPSGQVTNVRILAEVPSAQFGESVTDALEGAQAVIPAGTPDACLKGHNLTADFYITEDFEDRARR